METQFELLLDQNESLPSKPRKQLSNGLALMLAPALVLILFIGSKAAMGWLAQLRAHEFRLQDYQLKIGAFIGVTIIWLLRRLDRIEAVAVLGPARLELSFLKSGKMLTFSYENLKTHFHESRYEVALHLEYPDGRSTQLQASFRQRSFTKMVVALEVALYRYQHGRDRPPSTYLGPALLRARFATALLVVGAIIMVALTLFLPDTEDDTRLVVLCVGYGALAFYFLALGSARTPKPPLR